MIEKLRDMLYEVPEVREEWRDVVGYEGFYQISNLGRMKSLSRIRKADKGEYQQKEKILKLTPNNHGYIDVNLSKLGIVKRINLHKLVLHSFIKSRLPEHTDINHKNGIKTDNRLENLEWCTRSENIKHAYNTGLKIGSFKGKFGREHPSSRKVRKYRKTGEYMMGYDSIKIASEMNKVNRSSISMCCSSSLKTAGGYIWKYSNTKTPQ